jgi:hypothetical protein
MPTEQRRAGHISFVELGRFVLAFAILLIAMGLRLLFAILLYVFLLTHQRDPIEDYVCYVGQFCFHRFILLKQNPPGIRRAD